MISVTYLSQPQALNQGAVAQALPPRPGESACEPRVQPDQEDAVQAHAAISLKQTGKPADATAHPSLAIPRSSWKEMHRTVPPAPAPVSRRQGAGLDLEGLQHKCTLQPTLSLSESPNTGEVPAGATALPSAALHEARKVILPGLGS